MEKKTEEDVQLRLRDVKHALCDARNILRSAMSEDGVHADRFLAVCEQHIELSLLALFEGRSQMRELREDGRAPLSHVADAAELERTNEVVALRQQVRLLAEKLETTGDRVHELGEELSTAIDRIYEVARR